MQVPSSLPNKKIVILGTGGTIAGRAQDCGDNTGYTAAVIGIEELLKTVPSLRHAAVVLEQISQIDSKDMTFDIWSKLAACVDSFLAQQDVQGVVITHGTDTLEETAFFLQSLLQPVKPVVLTCAMRPASALFSDGPQNLQDAVTVASQAHARGVTVVCAGAIHSALDVQKVHTYKLDAFSSADAGPVGYIEEGTVRLLRAWPASASDRVQSTVDSIFGGINPWPKVEILMSYAGANGASVQAMLAAGVQGIVVAGTGNGTIHEELVAALLKAQATGIRIVRATRCLGGRIISAPDAPFEDAKSLTPVKARIALILQLMADNRSNVTARQRRGR